MKLLMPILLLLTIFIIMPGDLMAEENQQFQLKCAKRSELVKLLNDYLGQKPTHLGLNNGGQSMLEIFVSEKSGSWSAVMSGTTGLSCIVSEGPNWFKEHPGQKLKGDPS